LVRLSGKAREWYTTGISTFFCGGGSLLPFYNTLLLAEANKFLKMNYDHRMPFVLKEIPRPTSLIAPHYHTKHFHRLAVAFGLSYPAGDLGKILSAPKIIRYKSDDRFDIVKFHSEGYVPKEYC
jgi:hypothetical protein